MPPATAGRIMRAPSYRSLDDALEALAPYGITLKNGNSNHAPMVAEALCALGRPDAVGPWIGRYRERMVPRPPPRDRIRSGERPQRSRPARSFCRLACVLWRRAAGSRVGGSAGP